MEKRGVREMEKNGKKVEIRNGSVCVRVVMREHSSGLTISVRERRNPQENDQMSYMTVTSDAKTR